MDGVSHITDPLAPRTKSVFLADVIIALSKRRKAIRHKTRNLAVARVLERTSAAEHEKLEVSADVNAARLRLFVWDDRWVFVDARVPTKGSGWAWEFTYQGRLAGPAARTLIAAFERTIDATASQDAEELECAWKPLLATGPRASG